ncbi:LysR family transcriptional regulator [Paracoccaceae bacterium GXU_MW_L88]
MSLDWDKLRIFHAVADAGSLTGAGDVLHLSQPAVSRQIRALEDALDATLFHRHARGLILTEQGELLFDATRHMSQSVDAATARIRDSEDEVFGKLRVTTPIGFGTLFLAPRLGRLFSQFPKLNVDMMLDDKVLDLGMREADVAIRMKEPSQADLIRRRLMDVRMRLYASAEYVEEHGKPTTLEQLSDHRIISQDLDTWQVSASVKWLHTLLATTPNAHMTVNNYFGILQATRHGLGIGVLPDYVTAGFSELVRVLPGEQSTTVPVYLAYAEELRSSSRVSAFRDFVLSEIQDFRKQYPLET